MIKIICNLNGIPKQSMIVVAITKQLYGLPVVNRFLYHLEGIPKQSMIGIVIYVP